MADGEKPTQPTAYDVAEQFRGRIKSASGKRTKEPLKIGKWEVGYPPTKPKEAPPAAKDPPEAPMPTPGRLMERIKEAKRRAPEPEPSGGGNELERALKEGAAAKEAGKLEGDVMRHQVRLIERLAVLKAAESGEPFDKVYAEEQARVAEMLGPAPRAPGEVAPEAVTGAGDVVNLEHDLDIRVDELIRRQAEKRVRESETGGGLTTDQFEAAIAGEEGKIRAEMKEVFGPGATAEAPVEATPAVSAPAAQPTEVAPVVSVSTAEKMRPEPLSQRFDTAKFSETLTGLSADTPIPPEFIDNLRAAVKANITKVLWERTTGGQASFPGDVLDKPVGKERDRAASAWVESIAEGQANDLTRGDIFKNAFRLYISVKEGLNEGLAEEGRDPMTEAMRVAVYALTNVAKITVPEPFGSHPTPEGTLGDPLDKIFVSVAEAVLRRNSSHAQQATEKLGRLFTQKRDELEATVIE